MTYTTIFEKLVCLIQLISTSWLDIAFLGISLFLVFLLCLKKISRKTSFLLITLACVSLFGIIIYQYFEQLNKMTDTLIDNLFTSIYFPSTYAYLFILIMIDVVAITNLLNPKKEKTYKTIHGIFFLMTNFVLTIILEIIAKNKIDIFSKESLFSNTNLITLLEFSMNLFILWIVVLAVAYFINIITEHVMISKENKVLEKEPANIEEPVMATKNLALEADFNDNKSIKVPSLEPTVTSAFVPDTTQNHFIPTFTPSLNNNVLETQNTYMDSTYYSSNLKESEQTTMNYNQFVPTMNSNNNRYEKEENNIANNTFDLSSFIPKKQDIRPLQDLNTVPSTNQIFEQILRNELPVINPEPVSTSVPKIDVAIEQEKSTYTLNDYRIFNKMLKDIREHNQSNSIRIDKNLEYRLITKYSTETYNMFKKMLKIYSN